MNYIGEHLFPGQLGHFLLVLSLVSSVVATIAYYRASNAKIVEEQKSWRKLGRLAFLIDAISVVLIFIVIYFIISSHLFEYHYAWNHSDKSLPLGYLISSIWEGQEGSFLLWAIWHGVIGIVLMKTAGKWESPVMTVLSFCQVCLATMVLGIYVFGLKVGSNPFLLTREVFQDAPIFKRPDYLSLASMQDGNGLNQTLQNYWMVIHPPILFLGFASTIVPFAFAIAGLWKKEHYGWTKISLPWSLFSSAILCLGIMMGARWAYESLSFGGYWAWDPVENTSLVAWLVMVAGVHTQVIYNSTGHSLRPTYFFFLTSFLLILYSTYLTRSGDLQDTSVHAFTGSGLNWQLRAFVFVFLLPGYLLYLARYKKIPYIQKEESSYSREFWMFIGSLVLFLSAMFIILFTSLPVVNKIFKTTFTVGSEVEFFYNRIQIFVAIVLGLLTAISQYLRYKDTNKKTFAKKLIVPTLISLVISAAISYLGGINYDRFGIGFLAAIHIALFTAVYATVANAGYIWSGLGGRLKAAGASVGHVGFGIFLVGVLISSSKEEVLSVNFLNPLNFGPDSDQKGTENLTLFKGVRTDMGKYWATYKKDSADKFDKKTYFHIEIEKKDNNKKFTLVPDLIRNTKGQEGLSANPAAKHYWNRDIFSYITYAEVMNADKDTAQFKLHPMANGDTVYYSNGLMVLEKVIPNPVTEEFDFKPTDTAIMADISIHSSSGRTFKANPVFYVKNNVVQYHMDTVFAEGLAIGLSQVIDNKHLGIIVKESSQLTPFIALKVLQFPFINLVWLGTIVMITGFIMSMVRRSKLMKRERVA
ncbi:MAG: cytochrome c biogenesis protein CcsA [Chitinophagaceae bacterium]|nr:cytochrome c biogenesis protein CcsA [Chitinophagaceae bacterium]